MSGKHNDGSRKGSALWAIDLDWLAKTGQAIVDNGDSDVIAIQDVKDPNPRMEAQKGVLLVNRSPHRTFTESVLGMLLKSPIAAERPVVSKLVVSRDRRVEMLQDLEKMGIYRSSMLRPNAAVQKNAESTRDRMRERTANERDQFIESLRTRMESLTPR